MPSSESIYLQDLSHPWARRILLVLMAALYVGFGFVHILRPDPFLPIMPDWVPYPRAVVVGTGVCEIAGGIGTSNTRFSMSTSSSYPTAGGITVRAWRFNRFLYGGRCIALE